MLKIALQSTLLCSFLSLLCACSFSSANTQVQKHIILPSGKYTLVQRFEDKQLIEASLEVELSNANGDIQISPQFDLGAGIRPYIQGKMDKDLFKGVLDEADRDVSEREGLSYKAAIKDMNSLHGEIFKNGERIGYFSLSPQRQLSNAEKAICNAISFSADPCTISKWGRESAGWNSLERNRYVIDKFGVANLSSFLMLGNSPGKLKDYDFYVDKSKLVHCVPDISAGNSIVMMCHITNIKWVNASQKHASGSFNFERKGIFNGRCLFEASQKDGSWFVTKLVIANKNSDSISSGFIIFDSKAPSLGRREKGAK